MSRGDSLSTLSRLNEMMVEFHQVKQTFELSVNNVNTSTKSIDHFEQNWRDTITTHISPNQASTRLHAQVTPVLEHFHRLKADALTTFWREAQSTNRLIDALYAMAKTQDASALTNNTTLISDAEFMRNPTATYILRLQQKLLQQYEAAKNLVTAMSHCLTRLYSAYQEYCHATTQPFQDQVDAMIKIAKNLELQIMDADDMSNAASGTLLLELHAFRSEFAKVEQEVYRLTHLIARQTLSIDNMISGFLHLIDLQSHAAELDALQLKITDLYSHINAEENIHALLFNRLEDVLKKMLHDSRKQQELIRVFTRCRQSDENDIEKLLAVIRQVANRDTKKALSFSKNSDNHQVQQTVLSLYQLLDESTEDMDTVIHSLVRKLNQPDARLKLLAILEQQLLQLSD